MIGLAFVIFVVGAILFIIGVTELEVAPACVGFMLICVGSFGIIDAATPNQTKEGFKHRTKTEIRGNR